MPMFGRRAARDEDPLAGLRRAVANRGQAEIAEARRVVDELVGDVVRRGGGRDNPRAEAWARDRLRFFLVIGSSATWLRNMEGLPEPPQLRAELLHLVRDPARFGPEHLVAWWWHLYPDVFKPSVAAQLGEMRGALVDGVAEGIAAGGDFAGRFVDWDDVAT